MFAFLARASPGVVRGLVHRGSVHLADRAAIAERYQVGSVLVPQALQDLLDGQGAEALKFDIR
jgi:hypothetical protein